VLHLAFCDRVILYGRERGGRNRLEGNRGTRGVYLFATGLITKRGSKTDLVAFRKTFCPPLVFYIYYLSSRKDRDEKKKG